MPGFSCSTSAHSRARCPHPPSRLTSTSSAGWGGLPLRQLKCRSEHQEGSNCTALLHLCLCLCLLVFYFPVGFGRLLVVCGFQPCSLLSLRIWERVVPGVSILRSSVFKTLFFPLPSVQTLLTSTHILHKLVKVRFGREKFTFCLIKYKNFWSKLFSHV